MPPLQKFKPYRCEARATTVSVSPYTLTLSDHAGCAYFLKQDGITDVHPNSELVIMGLDQANPIGLNNLAAQVSLIGRVSVIVNESGTKLSLMSAPKTGFRILVR